MSKVLTITDIRINNIRFERDDSNNITMQTDYHYKDVAGVIPGINLQVHSIESEPIANFPANVQSAFATINSYVEGIIKTAEGI